MSIQSLIHEIFSEKGSLIAKIPNFRVRREQILMAQGVARAFEQKEIFTVQAGTGIGKSFAYLVPAILHIGEEKGPVVVSTATIPLQDQLWQKDLPVLAESLGIPFTATVVKGAQQYLCLDRLNQVRTELPFSWTEYDQQEFSIIAEWSLRAPALRRSDLPLEPSPTVWQAIEVYPPLCLGERCPYAPQCTFLYDRYNAQRADILFVNHSLLLSDLVIKVKSSNAAGVLPPFKHLIIDEAHRLEQEATEACSVSMSLSVVLHALDRLTHERKKHGTLTNYAHAVAPLITQEVKKHEFDQLITNTTRHVRNVRRAAEEMFEKLHTFFEGRVEKGSPFGQKLRFTDELREDSSFQSILSVNYRKFLRALKHLGDDIENLLHTAPQEIDEEDVHRQILELQFAKQHLEEIYQTAETLFASSYDDSLVRWAELPPAPATNGSFHSIASTRLSGELKLIAAPTDVSIFLRENLFRKMETVVLTSATLAVNGSFDFLHERIGLNEEKHRSVTLLLPSPFPYEKHALLLVPTDMPDPRHPAYEQNVCEMVTAAISASHGKALVLFTSHHLMNQVHRTIADKIKKLGIEVYRQGELPRTTAIRHFREDIYSVLFGTNSFWEGIDVVGESLSLVIITRLPFPVPTDPLVAARSEIIAANGGNAFTEYFLPIAAMRFLQGFGRLIRSENDRGCVLCLDPRLVTEQYGDVIRETLPPVQLVAAQQNEIINTLKDFFQHAIDFS